MIKKFTFALVLSSLAFALSCTNNMSGDTRSNSNAGSNRNAKPAASAAVKKGVAPVADNEIAVVETDFGTIKMELYSNIAPKMVARFKELAQAGFYDGIAFHRINDTVIQAGNPDTKGDVPPAPNKPEGDSGKPNVEAEFSDVPYTTGILGAARLGNDVNSQNSQFFIMLRSEPQFNGNYTVFGKVIEGMNTVMTISGVPRERERPNPAVKIKSIKIQPK